MFSVRGSDFTAAEYGLAPAGSHRSTRELKRWSTRRREELVINKQESKMALRTLRTLRSLTRRSSSTFASLNGVPTPAASLKCSIWDVTFQRGDGVFEAVRVIKDSNGVAAPRAVGLHLDRLERSASALELPLPPRGQLEAWLRDAARNGGEQCINQIVATRLRHCWIMASTPSTRNEFAHRW